MNAKRPQLCRVVLIFRLGLFFSIGLVPAIRAEETIVFRKETGPDAFGKAVDISGNTLIVGAPSKHNGEVYIFARQGTNGFSNNASRHHFRPEEVGSVGRSVLMGIPLSWGA